MVAKQVGFRLDGETHEQLTVIASTLDRSLSNVLTTMVREQVSRVSEKGWDAVFHKKRGNIND